MGRGERAAAARTASSLLFGPRGRQTLNTRDRATLAEIESANLMINKGDLGPAIDLMLRFNDEALDDNPAAERLQQSIAKKLESDGLDYRTWRQLIDGLKAEIDKDGSVKAFDSLAPALAAGFKFKLAEAGYDVSQLGPSDKAFLLGTDHPIPDHVIKEWAKYHPNQALSFGVEDKQYSAAKQLAARQGFYQVLVYESANIYHGEELLGANSPLLSDRVKEDMDSGRAEPLIREMLVSSQEGGKTLFGRRATSQGPDQPVAQEEMFARLYRRLPEQDQKECLKELRWYLGWAANKSFGSSSELAYNMKVDSEGKAELIAHHKDWVRRGEQVMEEAILAGRRNPRLYQEQQKVAKIIAEHSRPEDLAKMPVFGQEADPVIQLSWQQFHNQHLARRMAPDKKLNIPADDWQAIITNSLSRVKGNPFQFAIQGQSLIDNLSQYLNRQTDN